MLPLRALTCPSSSHLPSPPRPQLAPEIRTWLGFWTQAPSSQLDPYLSLTSALVHLAQSDPKPPGAPLGATPPQGWVRTSPLAVAADGNPPSSATRAPHPQRHPQQCGPCGPLATMSLSQSTEAARGRGYRLERGLRTHFLPPLYLQILLQISKCTRQTNTAFSFKSVKLCETLSHLFLSLLDRLEAALASLLETKAFNAKTRFVLTADHIWAALLKGREGLSHTDRKHNYFQRALI